MFADPGRAARFRRDLLHTMQRPHFSHLPLPAFVLHLPCAVKCLAGCADPEV